MSEKLNFQKSSVFVMSFLMIACTWPDMEESQWQSWKNCVKALRCLGSLSCCSMNPSPPRSNQRVEHVSEERALLLLRQGGVSSVQESENSPRCESSSSMFQCGFKHCGIILSAVCLLTYTPLLLTLIYHWDSSVNRLFFIIHCEILVFLRPPQVFVLVSSWEVV